METKSMGLIYLASPYSHPAPAVREQRFKDVCRVAAKLMRAGHLIFSPIAHTHSIALAGDLPTGWEFWQGYDRAHLDAASQLWVLELDGWEQSVGIAAETEYMRNRLKPILYVPKSVVESDAIVLSCAPETQKAEADLTAPSGRPVR
jgi:hypothetical protein